MSYDKNDLGYDLGYEVEACNASEVAQSFNFQPEAASVVYRMSAPKLQMNYGKPQSLPGSFGVTLDNPKVEDKPKPKVSEVADPFAGPAGGVASNAGHQGGLARTEQTKKPADVPPNGDEITVGDYAKSRTGPRVSFGTIGTGGQSASVVVANPVPPASVAEAPTSPTPAASAPAEAPTPAVPAAPAPAGDDGDGALVKEEGPQGASPTPPPGEAPGANPLNLGDNKYQTIVGPKGEIFVPGNVEARHRAAFIAGAQQYVQENRGLPAKDLNAGALAAGNQWVENQEGLDRLKAGEAKYFIEQGLNNDPQAKNVYEAGKMAWRQIYQQGIRENDPMMTSLTPQEQEEYAQLQGKVAVSQLKEKQRPFEGLPPELVGSPEGVEAFEQARNAYLQDPRNAGQDPATLQQNAYNAGKTAGTNKANQLDERKRAMAAFMKEIFMMIAHAVVQVAVNRASQAPTAAMLAMQALQMGSQMVSYNNPRMMGGMGGRR